MTRAKKSRRQFAPQPGPQTDFLSSPARVCIYGGAAGGGKSWGLLAEGLRNIDNPSYYGVIFRRTTPQLRNPGGLWDEASSFYSPIGLVSNVTRMEFYKRGGGKIKFAHMEHRKNRFDWQGAQMHYIGFDELTHFDWEQFEYVALSRGRSKIGTPPYVRATCNPDPTSWVARFIGWWINQKTGYPIKERSGVLRWMYRRQIDGKDDILWYDSKEEAFSANPDFAEAGVEPLSVTFIPATLEDNKILQESDPEYRSKLMMLGHVERERLLGGNWKIRSDSVGKIWSMPLGAIYEREDDEYYRGIVDDLASGSLIAFGWDFGSGPSLLTCIGGRVEMLRREVRGEQMFLPRIWVEQEYIWSQQHWRKAALDVRMGIDNNLVPETGHRRGGEIHFCDPTGVQRESNQSSWIGNLRYAGINAVPLPVEINSQAFEEWTIKQVQLLLDDGRLMIGEHCSFTIDAIDKWERAVPEGIDPDDVSRPYIPPKHDRYSHPGHSIMYLVSGVLMYFNRDIFRSPRKKDTSRLGKGERSTVEQAREYPGGAGRAGQLIKVIGNAVGRADSGRLTSGASSIVSRLPVPRRR